MSNYTNGPLPRPSSLPNQYKIDDLLLEYDFITTNDDELTDWEESFLKSIKNNKTLSQKQYDCFLRIYNRIFNLIENRPKKEMY